MNEEKLRIVQMVGEGKITAEEAEKLLSAMEASDPAARENTQPAPDREVPPHSEAGSSTTSGETDEDAQSRSFPAAGIRRVRVSFKSGDITVRGADTGEITAVFDGSAPTCEVSGDTLEIKSGGNAFGFFGMGNLRSCNATITLPRDMKIELKSANGDISAEDINADTAVSAVNGDISLRKVSGRLKLSTVNGDLDGEVDSSDARITTVNGDISLRWQNAPQSGRVGASSVSGDIDLAFPAATQASVKMNSVRGDRHSDFPGSGGPFTVQINSVSGDLSVRKI